MIAVDQILEKPQRNSPVRGFVRASGLLKLTRKEQSELLQLSALHRLAYWQNQSEDLYLSSYQVKRLTYLLAIFQLVLEQSSEDCDCISWARTASQHEPFCGDSPLNYMLGADNSALRELCALLLATPLL